MYLAHARREACDELRRRRDAIVTGAWANTNLDGEEGRRSELLAAIEDQYEESVLRIYGKEPEEKEVDFAEHPFFKSMKLPELPGSEEMDIRLGRDATLAEMLRHVEVDQAE